MGYIAKILTPNEKVIFTAKVHKAVYLPSILFLIIGIVMFIYSLPMAVIINRGDAPLPEPTINNLIGSSLLCISVLFLLYSIVLVIVATIVIKTTEFAVTNKRVIAKSGFIRIHTIEILLSKVESIDIDQPVLGRILNYGTVTVTGTGGTKQGYKFIADPMNVRSKVNSILEKFQHAINEYYKNNPNITPIT